MKTVNLLMERLRERLKEEKKKERKYKIVWLFMESLREMRERGKSEGKKKCKIAWLSTGKLLNLRCMHISYLYSMKIERKIFRHFFYFFP